MVYNDSVTKLNRAVKMFPSSIVAGVLGINAKDYLVVDDNKKDMPNLEFR